MDTRAKSNHVRELFPELELVSDKELVQKTCDIWAYFWEEGHWENIEDAPFDEEGTNMTYVQHIQSTVKAAIGIANALKEAQPQGAGLDMDTIIIGSILHDVSKPMEYDVNGLTEIGAALQHCVVGAAKALEMKFPLDVIRIIVCHTPQSNHKMNTPEGAIVKFADRISSVIATTRYDEF